MTPDPFDRLQELNPMPDDTLPAAPMSAAERIMAGRPRRRPLPGWAMATAAAVAVAALGGAWLLFIGGDASVPVATEPPSAVSTSTVPPTTLPPAVEPPATEPSETTPTTEPETTDTTLIPVGYGGEYPVYVFLEDTGTETMPGPYLVPTMRTTAVLSAPVTNIHATVAAFLMLAPHPGEAEAFPAMSTAIPAGTEVLGVDVADGVATIDLSAEFVSGGGTLSMMGRLAQVVFTLTAFEDVDAVRFEIEGEPTTVFGGEGIVVDDPATRDDFEGLLPAVMIETPPNWGRAGNPAVVTGTANVFEATVSLALTDGDGLILWEGFTTATCGTGCRGDFSVEIPYDVDEAQMGSLIAWEDSPRDGSRTNIREHAVWLEPAGATPTTLPTSDLWQRLQDLRADVIRFSGEVDKAREAALAATDPDQAARLERIADALAVEHANLRDELRARVDEALSLGWPYSLILDETCSGAAADTNLPDQGLERPVLETWGALHQAAVSCDWDALGDLAGDALRYTFGMPGDAIEFWQREEALGYEPIRHLAELLARPHAEIDPGNGSTITVWPSAFAYDSWEAVPESEREALRPLYGEADFAGFSDFGAYIGYRIGIDTATGRWVFFVAGD